jgi:hypothetical protein
VRLHTLHRGAGGGRPGRAGDGFDRSRSRRANGPQRFGCRATSSAGDAWQFDALTTIHPPARFDAPSINLDTVVPGKECEATARFETKAVPGKQPARLIGVTTPSDGVQVSIREEKPEGQEPDVVTSRWQVSVRIVPGFASSNTWVTAQYERAGVRRDLTLPVVWHMRSFYTVEPARVFFGCVGSDAGSVRRQVTLKHADGQAFTVRSVKSSAKAVECSFRPEGPETYRLDLMLNAAEFSGFLSGDVTVETDVPQQPVVKLPFAAYKAGALRQQSE